MFEDKCYRNRSSIVSQDLSMEGKIMVCTTVVLYEPCTQANDWHMKEKICA
jgi:hypothetical protein